MAADLVPWSLRRSSTSVAPLLVLGTMNFGRRTEEAEARRILDVAFERGLTHWDTANAYVDGEGEKIVGRALRGRRDRVLLATKVGLLRLGGKTEGLLQAGGRPEGLSRARIFAACDASLERLGADYIDVYYLHVPDPTTPIRESVLAMGELIRSGKIRAWAFSNYSSWQALEMIHWCDANGVPRPLLAQQLYNVLIRQLDLEYSRFAARYSLPTCAYNPLAGGLLARPPEGSAPAAGSRFDANPMYQGRYWHEVTRARVEDYRALARDAGLSLPVFAYAWLAARPNVDSIVVGPGTAQHLDAAFDGVQTPLSPEILARVEALHVAHQGTDASYAR